MNQLLRYGFIGIIFPLLVTYVFYFQFTTNYTQDLFSEAKFRSFYGSNVYQTRKLGKDLHLWVYERLKGVEKFRNYAADPYQAKRLQPMDAAAEPLFYLTYFFIAAFFTVLTALLTLRIFDQKELFPIPGPFKDLVVCLLVLLIGFTQFVVTPYDTPGYFFMAAGILLFLRYWKTSSLPAYVLLLLVIVVATFNRETSLLLLSFMAAIYFSTEGISVKWIRRMILPALCFLLPYLYLKIVVSGGHFTDESKLAQNLHLRNPYSMMGFLFAAFVIWLLYRLHANNRRLISSYLVFSLPYILIIFLVGITQEFRLWMPLLQGGIILSLLVTDRQWPQATEMRREEALRRSR